MIKSSKQVKLVDKHAQTVASAHAAISHHGKKIAQLQTAEAAFLLYQYQLKPRLARCKEIHDCPVKNPLMLKRHADLHQQSVDSVSSLERLAEICQRIIADPQYREIHDGKTSDAIDKKARLSGAHLAELATALAEEIEA